ncbi:hypothetical protein E0Z10_g3265 [Xylaria hypoxylon]|uniref:Uncharacterized protein n=1 Tax=Xylaria hypoxylon TaxID=37992 RepID=A0A4Z0ZAB3_9PEZI|nr:hypothetical protein E0Z10_g3265 [Xylaria hypoxylon]
MANPHDLDLPIALRRTPRRCASTTALQPARARVVSAPLPTILKTPSKPRPKKRVRFSDPGPELSDHDSTDELFSTGLTPMIKRSSLGEPAPKRRRGSTGEKDTTQKRGAKARSRKENSAITAKEVQRLRAELANRDAEIERLQNETLVHDTERIMELEGQVESLRTELAQQQLPPLSNEAEDEDGNVSDGGDDYDLPSSSFYDWTLAARDPFSDISLDGGNDFTARDVDVACSTPSRGRKSADAVTLKSASASFPTPPCTSPTMPATPCSVRRASTPVTPHFHAGVQASLPDPEKEVLEAELGSLRLELTKLTETLDTHAALQMRLSKRLSTASSPASTSRGRQPELEERVNSVLQALSDRTAVLSELNSSLSSLGFAGSDASAIIASIASGFRQARLELEYITPGELTLPLTSHAAEVLDLVVSRLRELARKASDDEETIDEYHALELSLRQQLSARVDAMENMREEHKRNATVLRERDDRIAELEVGLARLKGAAEGYRRDIGELETLVQRLDGDGKAAEAKLRGDLDGAQTQLSERTAVLTDLETKLATTLKLAEELQAKLKDLQRRKDAEAKVRNKSHGAALALRDARVMELRREIYGINESLRNAHEMIMKLRLENAGLERRAEEAEEGRRLAREAVDTMKAELEKVTAAAAAAATPAPRKRTRSSAAAGKGLATPEPQPGEFLSGGLARSGADKGNKRRKYDSGLGFLTEDEDEIELIS